MASCPIQYDRIYSKKSAILNLKYNVKIEDYALNYVLYNSHITTTLVGIKSISELENLLNILNRDLFFSERIYVYIMSYLKKYFNIELE